MEESVFISVLNDMIDHNLPLHAALLCGRAGRHEPKVVDLILKNDNPVAAIAYTELQNDKFSSDELVDFVINNGNCEQIYRYCKIVIIKKHKIKLVDACLKFKDKKSIKIKGKLLKDKLVDLNAVKDDILKSKQSLPAIQVGLVSEEYDDILIVEDILIKNKSYSSWIDFAKNKKNYNIDKLDNIIMYSSDKNLIKKFIRFFPNSKTGKVSLLK